MSSLNGFHDWEKMNRLSRQREAEERFFFRSLFLIAFALLIIAAAMFLSGCAAPSAASTNATNPAVAPELEGQGNTQQTNTETESETHQRTSAGDITSGDAGRDIAITHSGLSKDEIFLISIAAGMLGGLLLCGACFLILSHIEIDTPAEWIIYFVGIGSMFSTIGLGIWAAMLYGAGG